MRNSIMKDACIIARRLEDERVQYGCGGFCGDFWNAGRKLLGYYDNPQLVEYLFGLGELNFLGLPGSEKGKQEVALSHVLNGRPHCFADTERRIFDQIPDIGRGYFYDLDNRWYYVVSGPVRIKIPMQLLYNNCEKLEDENIFISEQVEWLLLRHLVEQCYEEDEVFRKLCNDKEQFEKDLESGPHIFFRLFELYPLVYMYFDDWVVVVSDRSDEKIVDFKLRRREEWNGSRLETINW